MGIQAKEEVEHAMKRGSDERAKVLLKAWRDRNRFWTSPLEA